MKLPSLLVLAIIVVVAHAQCSVEVSPTSVTAKAGHWVPLVFSAIGGSSTDGVCFSIDPAAGVAFVTGDPALLCIPAGTSTVSASVVLTPSAAATLSFSAVTSGDGCYSGAAVETVGVTLSSSDAVITNVRATNMDKGSVVAVADQVTTIVFTPNAAVGAGWCSTTVTTPAFLQLLGYPENVVTFSASEFSLNFQDVKHYTPNGNAAQITFSPVVCTVSSLQGSVIPPITVVPSAAVRYLWAPLATFFGAAGIIFALWSGVFKDFTKGVQLPGSILRKPRGYTSAIQPVILTLLVIANITTSSTMLEYYFFTPQTLLVLSYALGFFGAVGASMGPASDKSGDNYFVIKPSDAPDTWKAPTPTIQNDTDRSTIAWSTLLTSGALYLQVLQCVLIMWDFTSQPTRVFPVYWAVCFTVLVVAVATGILAYEWKVTFDAAKAIDSTITAHTLITGVAASATNAWNNSRNKRQSNKGEHQQEMGHSQA